MSGMGLWDRWLLKIMIGVIPIQKMFATDNPTRPIGHPPLGKGRVGEGSIPCVVFFFQIGITCVFSANCAVAQITPDRTLPNNSNVTINGNVFNIAGGTQAGRNLFHSFQQFSVPTGGTASFNNGLDVQNIFSRVTGGTISNIDGIIKANGTANLFFLNPNGIVFGKNASLDVGGSFVATTANAIQFGNLGSFSASQPNNPALLTINPTALFYNQIAAPIQNNSAAPAGVDPAGSNAFGLRVEDGKSLLLVGGNVNMDGGQLNAYSGRVELGGLTSTGNVGLNVDGDKLSLDFPASSTRADISLTNGASVNVSADSGGNIVVNANNLNIIGGSALIGGIARGLGSVGAQAGDITLNATGDVNLDGIGSSIANSVQLQGKGNAGNVIVNATKSVSLENNSLIFSGVSSSGIGKGGDIQINTGELSLTNGTQLNVSTFGLGNVGNVIVNATKSVVLDNNSSIFSNVSSSGIGNGGDIQINTGELFLTNGAQLDAGVFGTGNAGNVIVNATKSVVLGNNSLILSNVSSGSIGNGGDIQINTSEFSLTNRAQLSADTFGRGDAGNVRIKTNTLLVQDGAQVSVGTSGTGNGGSLSVNAQDVQLIGESADGQSLSGLFAFAQPSSTGNAGDVTIKTNTLLVRDGAQVGTSTSGAGNGGSLRVNATDSVQVIGTSANGQAFSGLFAQAKLGATGTAGDLRIFTRDLTVEDGATVTVSSPQAQAGDLTITAKNIRLDQGSLTAETAITSPNQSGANITLQGLDLLFLQNNSLISAKATTATVNGGNITINAPNGFIVAAPGGNNGSDIVASASLGQGGNINITSQSVFGLAQRPAIPGNGTNDIDASSGFGSVGTVTINIPDIEEFVQLVQLPSNLIEPSYKIVIEPSTGVVQVCTPSSKFADKQSSFAIIGRGGLLASLKGIFSGEEALVDLLDLPDNKNSDGTASQNVSTSPLPDAPKPSSHPVEIVEAQGWVRNSDGTITLVAAMPNLTPHNSTLTPASCQTSAQQ